MKNIILEYNNLIYSIINKYTKYFDKDDLYQVAVLGLISAYKNYKDDKNTKFSTYAYFYIIGEVRKFIRESNLLKVSKEMSKLNNVIIKAREVLSQKLGKEASIDEVSTFTGIDTNMINEIDIITSISKNIEDEENNIYYKDKYTKEELIDLRNELDNLNEFDRKLIDYRYMNDLTQKEVSNILGVNQVKVSRKERDILVRLKERLR